MSLITYVARLAHGRILFPSLLSWLTSISLQTQAAYIDSFAVGPQSFLIGPGDASAGGTVSALDTNQVLWGARSFVIYADQFGSGFRPLDAGSISVTVNGAAPGALNVNVAEAPMPTSSDYYPWLYLAYQSAGPVADWSSFDQIVITFTTAPSADMRIQTNVSADNSWYEETTVPAGAQSATILFSDLIANGHPVFTGGGVTSCSLSFNPPMLESFVIRDIQLTRSAAPFPPRLDAARAVGGVTLTWPTNAAGFVLQHATILVEVFTAVTNSPTVTGTNYSVTLPCNYPTEMFRLKNVP